MCALVALRHPRGTLTDPVVAHHEAAVDDVTCQAEKRKVDSSILSLTTTDRHG